ncbi:MAG: CoA-binding protein [Bacteroidales bacterium]|nr:CoA-binding protein [Bacteroidales bacterium]
MKDIEVVVVLGASENVNRYSNKAVRMLQSYDYGVVAIGNRNGKIGTIEIQTNTKIDKPIHTITLYLNSMNQKLFYDFIIDSKPKRVIFNPGTENYELMELLEKQEVECVEDCTLIMLQTGIF